MAGILLIGSLLHVYCLKGSEVCSKIISGKSNDYSENVLAKENSLHSENVLITAEIKHPMPFILQINRRKESQVQIERNLWERVKTTSPQERACRLYTSQTH